MQWESLDFGDLTTVSKKVITNLVIAQEANDASPNKIKDRYIAVDILKDPTGASQNVYRYFIDFHKKPREDYWKLQTFGTYLNAPLIAAYRAGNLTTIFAKLPGSKYFGTYNLSVSDGVVFYTPPFNFDNTSNPQVPFNFSSLQGLNSKAIAITYNADSTTNLFIALESERGKGANKIIFYIPGRQIPNEDGYDGGYYNIIQHDMLNIKSLYADTSATETVLWALNVTGQVFRLKCPKGRENDSNAWSQPIPIIKDGQQIAPYLNKVTGHSVIFAKTSSNELIKLKQDPTSKVWQKRNILLPTTDINNVVEYYSFTTHLQCFDANNAPLASPATINIIASGQASIYANGEYRVLSTKDQNVFTTDVNGSLTIVQETQSLSAIILTFLHIRTGTQITENPMNKIVQKVSANSASGASLSAVSIVDEFGNTKKLLPENLGTDTKDYYATALRGLVGVANKLSGQTTRSLDSNISIPTWGMSFQNENVQIFEGTAALNSFSTRANIQLLQNGTTINIANAIEGIAEDLFSWIRHSFDDITDYLIQEISQVSHFFIKIGTKVYHIILDTIHAVTQAFEFIFHKLKVAFNEVCQFVGFVFNWSDIVITHKVIKNIFNLHAAHAVNSIITIRNDITAPFDTLKTEVAKWAGLPNLPKYPTQSQSNAQTPRVVGLHSPQANFGLHHYKHNLTKSTPKADTTLTPVSDSVFTVILQLVEAEKATLKDTYDKIYKDIISPFQTLTLDEIMKRLAGILSITVLDSVKRTIIIILDAINNVLQGAVASLNDLIDFPVISWLYKKYAGADLTVADVVCLVCAIPATIVYKIAKNQVPFPKDNTLTNTLINATTLAQIQAVYNTNVTRTETSPNLVPSLADTLTAFFGICAVPAAGILIYNNSQTVGKMVFGKTPLTVAEGKTINKINAFVNIAYVSPNLPAMPSFLTARWDQNMNSILTLISIGKGFLPLKVTSEKGKIVLDWLEMGLNVVWLVPPIANAVYESSNAKYKGLVVETFGDILFDVGGIITPFIPLSQLLAPPADVLVPKGLYLAQSASMAAYSGLILVSGILKLNKS